MAYRVTQRIISSDDLLYPYFDDLCRKSKLLYNAALFRVRNIFTGYDRMQISFPDFQDRQHSRWSNSQSQISKTGLLL